MDYAEPLIQAKQALKDYEQAVLHKEWEKALELANIVNGCSAMLHFFAWKQNDSKS